MFACRAASSALTPVSTARHLKTILTGLQCLAVSRAGRSPPWQRPGNNGRRCENLTNPYGEVAELAARKQLPRVALCERRRAGFARLSGRQPVGNWVASAGGFSSIPVPRRRYPDNEQRIATHNLPRKIAQKPSRAVNRRARLQLTGRGRDYPPRLGIFSAAPGRRTVGPTVLVVGTA